MVLTTSALLGPKQCCAVLCRWVRHHKPIHLCNYVSLLYIVKQHKTYVKARRKASRTSVRCDSDMRQKLS
jgi:hypothetical protein